jgi:hypothetical protein
MPASGPFREVIMQNEADFKRIFCKSIKNDKGFTMKLAAPMFGGIPDIYCIYPGYMPVLLEAKWLGDVVEQFSRKIPLSALQLHWLEETNKVQNYSSFGLVGFTHGPLTYAVLTDHNVTQINHGFKNTWPYCIYNPQSKFFDVRSIFRYSRIPMMNLQPTKGLLSSRKRDITEGVFTRQEMLADVEDRNV